MSTAKVAIITRTKNRTILLRRAIESVLAQSFADWHMVIVNDGGEPTEVDNLVAAYLLRAAGRITVIHHPVSKGMEAASNVGLKASQSEYVIIHDDDDSWDPAFLERSVETLEGCALPSVAGVVTHSIRVLETLADGQVMITHQEPFNDWLEAVTLNRMAATNLFPPISFMYKRSVLSEIGGYREDLPVRGDWEFNLRFLQAFDIVVLPELLALYHHRLEASSGDYGNTVIGAQGKHVLYDALLKNEFLRRDLKDEALGIGFFSNLYHGHEATHSQIGRLHHDISRLHEHLSAFDAHMNNRLDVIEQQLEQLIQRAQGLERRLEPSEGPLKRLLSRFTLRAKRKVADAERGG